MPGLNDVIFFSISDAKKEPQLNCSLRLFQHSTMSSPYPRPNGDEESISRGGDETLTSFRRTLNRLLNGDRDERRSLRRREDVNEEPTERLPVPTVLPSPDVYSTPLPTLSIIVLSIVRRFPLPVPILAEEKDHTDDVRRIPFGQRLDTLFVVHG